MNSRDFFQDTFSETELRSLLGDISPSEIFSWRSPSFKKMALNRDDLNDDDLVRLMLEESRLIRRPLIRKGNKLIVGTDREKLAEMFPDL